MFHDERGEKQQETLLTMTFQFEHIILSQHLGVIKPRIESRIDFWKIWNFGFW